MVRNETGEGTAVTCYEGKIKKKYPGSLASPTLQRLSLTTERSTAALHRRPASARASPDKAVLRTAIKETHCLHADMKFIHRLKNDDHMCDLCIINYTYTVLYSVS